MNGLFEPLAARWPESRWLASACELAEAKWREHPHGDLPRWLAALGQLPEVERRDRLDCPAPVLGGAAPDPDGLRETLMAFHPWRKGPLKLGGLTVRTEWRSDWKWDRLAPRVELGGCRILDIGSGNGYFGLRMLGAGAKLVVGVDPTLLFVVQSECCRHFSGDIPNYVLPLGIEELPEAPANFDTVFSMGVLYHRKDPVNHLRRIRSLLKSGGTLVLETLVLPKGREEDLLIPEGRYARMRNVWAIPGAKCLLGWVAEAGFGAVEIVDITSTTIREQKSTDWMQFESLEQALDPGDRSLTVEGLPAPVRAVVIARSA
jgi:tRNA (mo5U34)-methyltransferase